MTKPLIKCTQCNGSGRYFRGSASYSTVCEKCNGEGKIKKNGDFEMNTEAKYDQALEVIVGLSSDIQELKEILIDRTNDIIHQQIEITQLKKKLQAKETATHSTVCEKCKGEGKVKRFEE
jgi:DnaJ-class molecular chaperone